MKLYKVEMKLVSIIEMKEFVLTVDFCLSFFTESRNLIVDDKWDSSSCIFLGLSLSDCKKYINKLLHTFTGPLKKDK